MKTTNCHRLLLAISSMLCCSTPAAASMVGGSQPRKFMASDAAAGDHFGRHVEIEGDLALVGAVYDDDKGLESGSAYLFNVATGQELHKLTASDGAPNDVFGWTLALDGGVALIGAPFDGGPAGLSIGSAYLFDAVTGQQQFKLTASDGAHGDLFGAHVALDGGRALVGAYHDDDRGMDSGSAYLFDAATGRQLRKITPADGAAGDSFGAYVAMADGLALIGSVYDDAKGLDSGSAYVFDAATGQQLSKLTADDGAPGDRFGYSVAISDGVVLVGAAADDDNGDGSGSAYLFDVATGRQLFKLTANDGAAGDQFGHYLAMWDGLALIGAIYSDAMGIDSGSAYLFDVDTGQQLAKLTASDGAANNYFGSSVAIDGGVGLVGAFGSDGNGTRSGSVYVFHLVPEPSSMLMAAMAISVLAFRAIW